MNVYGVETHWSKEYVAAATVESAVAIYKRINSPLSREDLEINTVQLLGPLLKT